MLDVAHDFTSPVEADARDSARPPARTGILDLRAGVCRWPLWAHDTRPVNGGFYCGAACDEASAYCAHHGKIGGGKVVGPPRGDYSGTVRRRPSRIAQDDVPALAPEGEVVRVDFRRRAAHFMAWRAAKNGAAVPLAAASSVQEVSSPHLPPGVMRVMTVQGEQVTRAIPAGLPTTALEATRRRKEVRQRIEGGVKPAPASRAVPAPVAKHEAPVAKVKASKPQPVAVTVAVPEFVESACNRAALAAVRMLLAGTLPGDMVYLHGPDGCGKSHLLQLALRDYRGEAPLRVLDRVETATARAVRETLCGAGPGLVAGTTAPGASAHSRLLSQAVVIRMEAPDDVVRGAVLERALSIGAAMSEEARALVIASELECAQILGLVRTLCLTAGLSGGLSGGVVLGVPEVARVLAELTGSVLRRVTVEDIIRLLCGEYRVSRADLVSDRRAAGVLKPRQIAMYLAKTVTGRALPEIGRRFGGRDHSTVWHAVKKYEQLRESDPGVNAEISKLIERLGAAG